MKKEKKKNKEALSEGIAEIVLTIIFFGIGVLIISLFGISIDSPHIDYDLLCLIGIVSVFGSFAIICAIVKWIKKAIKRKDK